MLKSSETKILEVELNDSEVGNFTFMVNWNFIGDEFGYTSYEDGYGTSNKKQEGSYSYCDHEWVDVGFNHPKLVCKKCDKDKEK